MQRNLFLKTNLYQFLKKNFKAIEAARKFNAVDCSSVLRVVVFFCDSFLCSISLLLLSDSLSCVLNSVL